MALGAEKVTVYPSDQQIRAAAVVAAASLPWRTGTPSEALVSAANGFVEYIKTGEFPSDDG